MTEEELIEKQTKLWQKFKTAVMGSESKKQAWREYKKATEQLFELRHGHKP